ncbi:sigma-54 interaction domain-containing protein [Flavonifractor hominis]|uniref:Sigma 54-interacting transcriptional regulator n=1 Tax=Flavonifractor hominis TaxID=3133178 RepID=A0ABV1ESC1_9FIRM
MEQKLIDAITEIVDEGIICVDAGGIVTRFSRKAKEMTGVVLQGGRSHPAGCIRPGDLVLIADNMLGDDDGGMTPEDLALLNIQDPELRCGDVVLAAGRFRTPECRPLYRRCTQYTTPQKLTLEGSCGSVDVSLTVDRQEKLLTIRVHGEDYYLRYLRSMAHLVVLDGADGAVKFYQEKGCTIRQEDLKDLLDGRPFQPKNDGTTEFDVVGRDFFELFQPCELTRRMDRVLSGGGGPTLEEELYINKRLMLCSILPVLEDGRVEGAVLKLTDLSELHKLLDQRNDLITKVEQASLNADNHVMRVPANAFPDFVGSSPPIQRVKYLAYKAARAKCNIILTGESGTGKSQLAREIHRLSRPDGPFVEVNCSSIPRDLFESELFGYVGGAFTGALAGGKPGYFEQANGGTIFLDEIGEIPMSAQVKLLYAIQNKRFYRVGATKPTDVDVRILSATNQNLWQAVGEGRFREDLYYRIHVFALYIPPLRERISDLYLLSRSLTETICAQYDIPPKKLSGSAVEKLLHHTWPGNIRELGNVIERAVAVSESSIITPEDIEITPIGAETEVPERMFGGTLREQLEYAEECAIRQALEAAGGDKRQAMKQLDIKKSSFYERLRHYGIN